MKDADDLFFEGLKNGGIPPKQVSAFLPRLSANIHRSYLNEFSLFLFQFGYIPHYIEQQDIDCNKAADWFISNFEDKIIERYQSRERTRATEGNVPTLQCRSTARPGITSRNS